MLVTMITGASAPVVHMFTSIHRSYCAAGLQHLFTRNSSLTSLELSARLQPVDMVALSLLPLQQLTISIYQDPSGHTMALPTALQRLTFGTCAMRLGEPDIVRFNTLPARPFCR